MSRRVLRFSERMANLRVLRELTGAPMASCADALDLCDGDAKAAARHPSLVKARGIDTGDPFLRCPTVAPTIARGDRLYHVGCTLHVNYCDAETAAKWARGAFG